MKNASRHKNLFYCGCSIADDMKYKETDELKCWFL